MSTTSLSRGWCAAVIKASSCSQLADVLVQVAKSCVVGGGGMWAQRYWQRVAEHKHAGVKGPPVVQESRRNI